MVRREYCSERAVVVGQKERNKQMALGAVVKMESGRWRA